MSQTSGLRGWTLITGASEGLGREFARIAAGEGRDMILVARQADKVEPLADELRASHKIAVEVIPTDLRDAEAVELLWRRVSTRRRIDVLVNNAELRCLGPFASDDLAREMSSIAVNVTALTLLMKRAVPHMRAAGGGCILNVASTAAFLPGANMAVYQATKAYVLSLSEAVSEELRGDTVTVTALCAGATATEFSAGGKTENGPLSKPTPPPDAESVALAGWQAMKKGQRIKILGFSNALFGFGPRLLPRAVARRIAALFLK